jgi:hypothetical protein
LGHLLVLGLATDTWTHKSHHGSNLGVTTTLLPILFSAARRRGCIQMAQIPGTPEMESRNCPGGTLGTLNRHNSRLQNWMAMRSEPKPLSRSFQRHVALPNRTSGRGRFPTFSGRESTCQFDSRPFFCQ